MTKPKDPKPDKKAAGRQSLYTPQMADSILASVADGKSLRKACELHGGKHSTWLEWVKADESLADQYARARAIGQEARFESLRDTAAAEPERDDKGRIDPAWVAWKRLEIDTEKWTLAKQEPRKYGDKIAVGGDADAPPIRTESTVVMTAEEAYRKMLGG